MLNAPIFLMIRFSWPKLIRRSSNSLKTPDVQERYTGSRGDYFREALPLATENMMALHNAGIRVAMGTDSGPLPGFRDILSTWRWR
jgi:hypothetical protein